MIVTPVTDCGFEGLQYVADLSGFKMQGMEQELILRGAATDLIWAMASPDGTIGLYLDSGEAGRITLTKEQARAVVAALQTMLST
jgi:hypothetical protein